MKSTGMVRKVDEMGRIVLPIEFRRILEIEENDVLEIYADEGSIILKKHCPGCLICGSEKDVVHYKGKRLCAKCIGEAQEILSREK